MRIKKFSAIIISVIMTLSLLFVVTSCNKEDDSKKYVGFEKASRSADGYATVYIPEGRDVNVMILSDPQVDTTEKYNLVGSLGTDKTYAFIKDMVATEQPDLVIINGDLVMSTVLNNAPYFKRYAEIFEELKVPWTFTFGNHDSENGWAHNDDLDSVNGQMLKDVLIDYMSSFDYCLINSEKYNGLDNEETAEYFGYGNNFVNIRDNKGKLVYTFCLFDCLANPEFTSPLGDGSSYQYVPTKEQIEWFTSTIKKLSVAEYGNDDTLVKSMIFSHVGIPEFKIAWDEAWNDGNPTNNYHYGYYMDGDYSDEYGDRPESEQIFAVAKSVGTTAFFMCHHHDNDFSVDYQGVRLTFGQHSGVSHNYRTEQSSHSNTNQMKNVTGAWKDIDFSRVDNYGNKRGYTSLSISSTGEFEIAPKYASEFLPNFKTDYYIDYDAVAETINNHPDYSGEVIRGEKREWKIA